MFECRLKIDGQEKKLSLKEGLNFKDLSEIFSNLSKCLSEKSSNFVLTKIVEGSYEPIIETDDIDTVENFNEIHELINSGRYNELPSSYQEYAKSLQNILFKNGLYIEISNSRDEKNFRLTEINIEKDVHFNSITSLVGVIVSIVGTNEKTPQITFKPNNGTNRIIFIKPEQEKRIKDYYKGAQLRLRVKIKVDADTYNHNKTDLIDFSVLNGQNFLDAIDSVKNDIGDIFSNIDDSAKLLNALRQ